MLRIWWKYSKKIRDINQDRSLRITVTIYIEIKLDSDEIMFGRRLLREQKAPASVLCKRYFWRNSKNRFKILNISALCFSKKIFEVCKTFCLMNEKFFHLTANIFCLFKCKYCHFELFCSEEELWYLML